MKLLRYGEPAAERPAVELEDGRRLTVPESFGDFNPTFFRESGLDRLATWVTDGCPGAAPVPADVRLASPVAVPGKIICIGLNFRDHAEASGMEPPAEPVLFSKATSSLSGPNDDLILPQNGDKTDWEVELAMVIGARACYVDEAQALDYVAGYTLHNDYSERAFQLERSGQWVKGKSCPTFAPLGPYLVSRDEIADVDNLGMWLTVNGEKLQDGNTGNLIFKIPHLVSYLSRFMTLEPGDVISTGTPAGVGLGFDPPRYLKAGDVVELGIDRLGSSRQQVCAFDLARVRNL